MSDDPVATGVDSDEGLLPFQRSFVERRCAPQVKAIRLERAAQAGITDGVRDALAQSHAISLPPSNPWLSMDPILAIPGPGSRCAGWS
jgi:LPPG:FO 2-phospho-L-lactate transferase